MPTSIYATFQLIPHTFFYILIMLKSECIETISEILQLLLADFFSYLGMFDFKGKEFSVNTENSRIMGQHFLEQSHVLHNAHVDESCRF